MKIRIAYESGIDGRDPVKLLSLYAIRQSQAAGSHC
jgi:hypothetical protein